MAAQPVGIRDRAHCHDRPLLPIVSNISSFPRGVYPSTSDYERRI
jgi:hypothetical protein